MQRVKTEVDKLVRIDAKNTVNNSKDKVKTLPPAAILRVDGQRNSETSSGQYLFLVAEC